MFQDSVPAGSYNDPFLSSVCVNHLKRCKTSMFRSRFHDFEFFVFDFMSFFQFESTAGGQ